MITPLQISNASALNSTSALTINALPIMSNSKTNTSIPPTPNTITPNLIKHTPITTLFPPLPSSTAIFSSTNIIPTHQLLTPTLNTQQPFINTLTPTQSFPLMPSSQIISSNVFPTPNSNIMYSNPQITNRISIPGFFFPEKIEYSSNYLSAGINDTDRLPIDASFSPISTKVICPRCGQPGMTNMQMQLGTASYLWCLALLPVACSGLCCLCLPDCKDRIHFCNCGQVVGYKRNSCC